MKSSEFTIFTLVTISCLGFLTFAYWCTGVTPLIR